MIKLPAIISDGMVLNKKARIWGWAEPETQVLIALAGKEYIATAAADGQFETTVVSTDYGGPHVLTIGDCTIKDVYIGQVWLCGGQSNMEQPLARTRPLLDRYIKDNPQIRAFHAEKGLRFDGPATDVKGHWQTATGKTLDEIFAVPYFFAQALELSQVPIGLVNVAAGGTPAEAWLSEDILRTFPELHEILEPYKRSSLAKTQSESDASPEQEIMQKWHQHLQASDKGVAEGWHSADYNHSHWQEKMLLDTPQEYGVIWYRKDIILPDDITGPYALTLGRVVDSVKVYVNGTLVTSVDYQYPPCRCIIPSGLLKPGSNTIAIRVVGSSNKSHFTPGKVYELAHSNGSISLLGPWKWQVGCVVPRLEPAQWLYNIPTCTYNYMLAPVLNYSVSGVIWYQGESNTGSPQGYKSLFGAFVTMLRKHHGEGLPVIYTQLANYVDPHGSGENWAMLRDEQRQCLDIPNTAMAVTIDCGEWNDLHPQDKKNVGERLALCARHLAYGEDIVHSGPVAKNAIFSSGELTINFEYGAGLWAKNGRPVVEVLGPNNTKHHLNAKICGESLIVQVGELCAQRVRFAWMDCPTVVLYNAYGLPASPFSIAVS
ncbi:MAG: sialate O-acetylesterase [Defluviitaleaceae bacterium]|nr:sialate O-acetylesterase [Defluviitaleaceae bacterium]